jgi:catechol 2,3-dioxygenase-like lactoylglutathione lyase family enzyme
VVEPIALALIVLFAHSLTSQDRLTYPTADERLAFTAVAFADQPRKGMEVEMASTDVGNEATGGTESTLGVDMNLEVVSLPVSDVDRAKSFYQGLGWRLDIDLVVSDDARTVQLTPPHSGCSIQFGKGRTTAEPGSAQGMILVVDDIDAARDDLINRGVDVSEVHEARPPGFDSPGRSYFARASFSDPDGNSWELQEITTRLPGREWED